MNHGPGRQVLSSSRCQRPSTRSNRAPAAMARGRGERHEIRPVDPSSDRRRSGGRRGHGGPEVVEAVVRPGHRALREQHATVRGSGRRARSCRCRRSSPSGPAPSTAARLDVDAGGHPHDAPGSTIGSACARCVVGQGVGRHQRERVRRRARARRRRPSRSRSAGRRRPSTPARSSAPRTGAAERTRRRAGRAARGRRRRHVGGRQAVGARVRTRSTSCRAAR